ncbi:MAG: ferredoxin [Candidatus Margulisbacteria bacterium]|nr:ferredoxin [Candidatus Margulisiibacteriota bacterium]
MALRIDEEKCIGCGVCCSMLETVFEMNDDKGIAIVKDPNGASKEQIQEAIDACPVEAISI